MHLLRGTNDLVREEAVIIIRGAGRRLGINVLALNHLPLLSPKSNNPQNPFLFGAHWHRPYRLGSVTGAAS